MRCRMGDTILLRGCDLDTTMVCIYCCNTHCNTLFTVKRVTWTNSSSYHILLHELGSKLIMVAVHFQSYILVVST